LIEWCEMGALLKIIIVRKVKKHGKKCNPCHKHAAHYRVHTVAYQWYERRLKYLIFHTVFLYQKKQNINVDGYKTDERDRYKSD